MSTVGTLVVKLLAETGSYSAAMNTAVQVSDKAGKSLGAQLSAGAIAAGTALGNLATKIATSVMSELNKMATALPDWASKLDSLGDVLGTTANQSAAIAVALKPFGSAAEDITTQMGKFAKGLLDVNGQMSPTAKFAQDMGIKFKDANGKLLPTMDLLKNVSDRLTQMPEGLDKTAAMMTLFGKSGKDMSDALGAMANGGLDEAAKKAQAFGLAIGDDGVKNVIDLQKASADLDLAGQGLAVSLGSVLLPMILPLVQKLAEWAVVVMPQLRAGFDQVSTALAPLINLIGSLISGISGGGDPFGVIVNSVYNFLTALGISRGEAATWAVGIATFAQNVITWLQTAVAWVQTNWPAIEAAVTPVINAIIGAIAGVVNWVVANWPQIQSYITGVFEQARPIVEAAINYVSTIVTTVFGAISQFLAENGGDIQNFIGTAWGSIQEIISGVLTVLQLTIVPIWNAIAKFISDNQDTIKAVIELVWNNIKMTISVVLDVIKGIINVFIKILKGDWQGAWDTIKETAVNVWNDIKAFFDNIPSQLVTVGKNIIDGIVKGLIAAQDQVTAALQKIINDAITSIKQMLGIQSPSTVFAGIGANMMMGLANGISGYGALPNVQLNGVVNGLANTATTPADTGATSGGAPITVQVVMDSQVITENVYHRMGDAYYADTTGQWGGVHA